MDKARYEWKDKRYLGQWYPIEKERLEELLAGNGHDVQVALEELLASEEVDTYRHVFRVGEDRKRTNRP